MLRRAMPFLQQQQKRVIAVIFESSYVQNVKMLGKLESQGFWKVR